MNAGTVGIVGAAAGRVASARQCSGFRRVGRREGWYGHVHFVIMGCGRTGSTLAQLVEDRGHTVAVVDQNPDAFRRLGTQFEFTITKQPFAADRSNCLWRMAGLLLE